MSLRVLPAVAAAVLVAPLVAGCHGAGAVDPLVARCAEVVRYEQPDWSGLRVVRGRRDASGEAVTLRVAAVHEPTGDPVDEFASCGFRVEDRAVAERVVIGDRTLDPNELALVNAELLLLDLGRGPLPSDG